MEVKGRLHALAALHPGNWSPVPFNRHRRTPCIQQCGSAWALPLFNNYSILSLVTRYRKLQAQDTSTHLLISDLKYYVYVRICTNITCLNVFSPFHLTLNTYNVFRVPSIPIHSALPSGTNDITPWRKRGITWNTNNFETQHVNPLTRPLLCCDVIV